MSGKKLLPVVFAVLLLFTGEMVLTQEAPKESMLIPVSLGVEQVEPFLSVGESVRGFKLAKGLSGLALVRSRVSNLWVSHHATVNHSKSSLTRWVLKPFWDSQGLTLLATEGHPGIRRFYGNKGDAVVGGNVTTATLLSKESGFEEPLILLASQSGLLAVTLSGRAYGSDVAAGMEVKAMTPLPAGSGRAALLLAGKKDGARDSGLYLYLGRKHADSRNPAGVNGLTDGRLLALKLAEKKTEGALKKSGEVIDFTFTGNLDKRTLFADASGLCADPGDTRKVYAVTKGSDERNANGGWMNHNGRLYSLSFSNPGRPEEGGTLKVLLGGTEGVIGPSCVAAAAGGVVLIGEAPRFPLPGRDTSIWKYEIRSGRLERLLEVRPPPGNDSERGEWKVSALLNASTELRPDWWLAAVVESSFGKGETGTKGQLVAVGLR